MNDTLQTQLSNAKLEIRELKSEIVDLKNMLKFYGEQMETLRNREVEFSKQIRLN